MLAQIKSPRIHLQYAKAKEAEGHYEDAAQGYLRGGDYDNLCRVYISHLRKIDEAVAIVRKHKSKESAKLIAKFFQTVQDFKAVVEFCIIADMKDEAFLFAKTYNLVEFYSDLVSGGIDGEELKSTAAYFEQHEQFYQAGKCFMKTGDYNNALRLFLLAPVSQPEALELAIDVVGKSKSEELTARLLSFLIGETDGTAKDPRFILKLYLKLGRFDDASKTVVQIATSDQSQGNYRQAHVMLSTFVRHFRKHSVPVPSEIEKMLMFLHSYVLVRTLIKIEDHEGAARMLSRVSDNISQFPLHTVPILTSTVIECHKADLKKSAFEYASIVCRGEYRSQIDEKYKRKIELIVRRPELEQKSEVLTPCPYCSTLIIESSLGCSTCKNTIPYCVASGLHMVSQDWTVCPNCEFPALFSRFQNVIRKSGQCPMCEAEIGIDKVELKDVSKYLRRPSLHDASSTPNASNDGGPVEPVVEEKRGFRATAPIGN